MQRSAISTVWRVASGRSANSASISARVLNRWSGESWRRLGRADRGAFRDADQRVVRLVIRRRGEEGLVGGHQPQAAAHREVEQLRLDGALLRQAVALHLDVEPVRAEAALRAASGGRAAASARSAARTRSMAPDGPPVSAISPPGSGREPVERDVRRVARRRDRDRPAEASRIRLV